MTRDAGLPLDGPVRRVQGEHRVATHKVERRAADAEGAGAGNTRAVRLLPLDGTVRRVERDHATAVDTEKEKGGTARLQHARPAAGSLPLDCSIQSV